VHALGGAAAALTKLFDRRPRSVLDVGCGTGICLRAAAELGIGDLLGLDGIIVVAEKLQVARELIREVDLRSSFFSDAASMSCCAWRLPSIFRILAGRA